MCTTMCIVVTWNTGHYSAVYGIASNTDKITIDSHISDQVMLCSLLNSLKRFCQILLCISRIFYILCILLDFPSLISSSTFTISLNLRYNSSSKLSFEIVFFNPPFSLFFPRIYDLFESFNILYYNSNISCNIDTFLVFKCYIVDINIVNSLLFVVYLFSRI